MGERNGAGENRCATSGTDGVEKRSVQRGDEDGKQGDEDVSFDSREQVCVSDMKVAQ